MTDDKRVDSKQDNGEPKDIPALFATIHHQSDDRPDGYTSDDIAELNRMANGGGDDKAPEPARPSIRTIVIAATSVAALAVSVTSLASPVWFPSQILSAAEMGDRSRLEQLVDFPAVRSSLETDLKDRMRASYQQQLANTDDDWTMLFSGVGRGLVDDYAGQMAAQVASPASLEKAAKGQDVWIDGFDGEPMNILPEFRRPSGDYPSFTAKGRYVGMSRYEYKLRSNDSDRAFTVQLKRTGPWSWQVYRVRIDGGLETTPSPTEATPANDQPVASPAPQVDTDPPPMVREGQLYSEFRGDLLASGFVAIPQPHPEPSYHCGTEYLDEGEPDLCVAYPEVEDCAGTGSRACTFIFQRVRDGRRLEVATVGELFHQITAFKTRWADQADEDW